MAIGVGASGIIGIAFETTVGTYAAPTKYISFNSESLKYIQAPVWRREIKGTADVTGHILGNVNTAGDLVFDCVADTLVYFLYSARATVVKTGTGPYVYNVTGNQAATVAAGRTLSITIVRNGVVFGYVGCSVSSIKLGINNGGLLATVSLIGLDETVQSLPTAAFTNQPPFGAGMYNIQIPTATQVFDMDTFEFTVNDNANPEFRLKNTGRGAQFIKYGQRDVTLTTARDFLNRTEYDAFKVMTAQSVTLKAIESASNEIDILIPVAERETYDISGLSGQATLIRAAVNYRGEYDATTGAAYKVTVTTTESIT